jgi:hypothetical protein
MILRPVTALLASSLLALACGGPSKADTFFLESVKKDLAEIKDKLTKGEDASLTCVAGKTYGEKLKGAPIAEAEPLVKELNDLCGLDVPLAKLEGAAKAAEEARKAKPDEAMLSECFSADQKMALKDLEESKQLENEKVKAASARFDAACPKK